jgi:hypothetical protein
MLVGDGQSRPAVPPYQFVVEEIATADIAA